MYSPSVKISSKPVKNRLGLKVAALFAASFLVFFIGLLFFDLLLTMGEGALVDSAVASQPAVTAIDPKLESELAKVLEYSDVQNTADIKNPFADQSGISSKVSPAAAQTTAPAASSSTSAATNPAAAQNNPQANQSRQNIAASTNQPNQRVVPDPQIETKARLRLREERIRLGMDGGPESSVFAVDDLLPVGTVAGGDGRDEVLFYSQTACRVVSFPVGTQFYDGWFEAVRSEGVVFRYFDRYRIPGTRPWETSTVSKCSERVSESVFTDRTEITAGGDD